MAAGGFGIALGGSTFKWNDTEKRKLLTGKNGLVARDLLVRGERVLQGGRKQVGVHTPDPWGRPKDRRPGTMRDSIKKRLIIERGELACIVGTDDPIAFWHHEGTRPHTITPQKAERLLFFVGNTLVAAQVVHHPGTQPNRFLSDNLRLAR